MKLQYRLVVLLVFGLALVSVIAYSRGYRLDFEKKTVSSTGIISISASPKASKVYVNGVLKGASDINITLPPGNYSIDVKKDGYTSWKKDINLKGEVVITLDVLLLPLNPYLSPLTNLGVIKAVSIRNSDKTILFSETGDATKDGIYLFESSRSPISFFTPLKTIILKKNMPAGLSFNDVTVDVAPDMKQGIFTFIDGRSETSYLLTIDEEQLQPFDIGKSKETLLTAWNEEKSKDTDKILESFPKEIAKVASDSFHIIAFSPDETKFLYQPVSKGSLPLVANRVPIGTNQTPESRNVNPQYIYVYDKKEDKNFQVIDNIEWMDHYVDNIFLKGSKSKTLTASPFMIFWQSDSKHIIFNEDKKISVSDYDGTNRQTMYSGPFINSFFTPLADGRIVILANLNPENNLLPDLYVVGTR